MTIQPHNSPKSPRIDWVDYGKGICIFFVVMLHVNELVQYYVGEIGWLEHVVEFARPFRMPDFFMIAGLFLSNVIARPWREYLDKKVVHFMYFYCLWMTLSYVAFDGRNALQDGESLQGVLGGYLVRFIDPAGPLWFIHMLPIFFVVTKLTRTIPWWVVWTVSATLHSLQIDTGWMVPDEFSSRFIYFYSGYVFSGHIFKLAAWAQAKPGLASLYLLAWGLGNQALVALGLAKLPGVSLVLGYLGAVAVISVASLLTLTSLASPVRYIGKNSLVVYLGDYVVSVIMLRIFVPFIPDVGSAALTITIATIIGTLVLWTIAIRTPGRFMYVRPTWLVFSKSTTAAPRIGDQKLEKADPSAQT